ncbi:MAG TPA: energy-coupling factor ABC transporter substrate-binding protein [Methanoregula sp.]|nr:energy-coupling factor ABC transporter substrate-binding protein [Methanoregula sp.]
MAKNYRLEILAVVAILVFCGVFLYTSSTLKGAGFAGSDIAGSNQIAELTGKPVESFSPLIPQWVPPGAEIEACLFALQAAIGGIFVGGVFGYWLGQRKKA